MIRLVSSLRMVSISGGRACNLKAGLLAGTAASLLCAIALFPLAVIAQEEIDPEWPCIQRLIVEVSPAVMWPIPVDETMQNSWRKDREVRKLAEQLGNLEVFDDEARNSIATFAESVSEPEKEMRLSLLATGVVSVSNRQRKQFIKGIKRYTRQQIAISKQIEDSLNQLTALEDAPTTDSAEKKQEIQETLHWHERVYDQRERSIISLCEEPVELEQQLSEILRETAQFLP